MKIADSVWLSLYMRDNEQHPSRPIAPGWAVLNSQHLLVLASMILKDQEKNSTVKYGAFFIDATRHLTV
jgi:hypothetical protein